MRFHALRHLQFEGLGMIEPWIRHHGHSLTETLFWESDWEIPSLDSFDFLIVMGGSMNVDEEAEFPWLVQEKAFIADCIRANKRILGICLGAQLISRALGHKVGRSPEKEIGWFPVEKKFDTHPLFPSLADKKQLQVMQWHGDMFDLPTGAESLFSSAGCPNQAFTLNENRVVGLQFHLELSDNHIRLFFDDGDNAEFDNVTKYIQLPTTILEESKKHVATTRQVLNELLEAMVNA
jgi:GMP synthase-like glutamine amidotransferase